MLSIACISQKGGVGKSTICRLIARSYAEAGWRVKIADFNVKQKTSVDWAAVRMSYKIEPTVDAQSCVTVKAALQAGHSYNLMLFDGKPESDATTLDIAKTANLLIIPTGVSADDLNPQVRFAMELKGRGIDPAKMLFVINKTTGSAVLNTNTRDALRAAGFRCAETSIRSMTGYTDAQNVGKAISETAFATLNDEAEALVAEIVIRMNELTR